jgi:mono/diheme cytochrome c family protein
MTRRAVPQSQPFPYHRPSLLFLGAAAAIFWPGPRPAADEDAAPGPGEQIYRRLCVSCHGEKGEGVKGGHERQLAGDKSVLQLARFIEKSMPEDAPGTCVGKDAEAVARYVHDAFYSPIAQARNRTARIELARLTVRQHRNAAADLVGSFREAAGPGEERGLKGEYFNSERPGRNRIFERIDPEVRFQFKPPPAPADPPVPAPGQPPAAASPSQAGSSEQAAAVELPREGFAARWEGSLLAPDTGEYEILVRTDHATRLWLNDRDRPLIDAWVKSGSDTEYRAPAFLIGGRAYYLKLEFTSRRQGVDEQNKKRAPKEVESFIELHWKLPRRVPEVIPARHLSPRTSPVSFVLATPFPPDDRSTGYERGTSISKEWDDATTEAAIATAGYVLDHLDELAGTRKSASDREARVRTFCGRFVERAFRRPLAEEERRLYLDRQFAAAPDLETAVKKVLLLALKSPRFLYLDPASGQPDAYTVASRLSFALWDSLPDPTLLEAAAAGRLVTRDEAARQAERLLGDSRARAKVRQFLHRWLDVEQVPELPKDAEHFPGFNEALASDLRTSLDLFLEDVVWGGDPDFRRLLLAEDLYLNGRLAGYYGFELPPDAPFAKVAAREPQRAGILSHPYLMARFAYSGTSSPIHRGVFLVRSVLGRTLRPPPEAFTPLAPELHPDLTTRERVTLQTEPEACQACHRMINPLGFTLERFDAAGRYRESEKGKPIDAAGSYELPSGERKTFDGARDLAAFLAGSEDAHQAFVSHLFHHLIQQPAVAYGPGVPADLRRAFAEGGFNIRKLLVEIAATAALAGVDPNLAPPPAPPAAAVPPPRPPRRGRL